MKLVKKALAVALAATLAMGITISAEDSDEDETLKAPMAANVYISGTVEVQEDGRLLVQSPNPDAQNSPIVLGYTDTTRVLDAVTLEAVDPTTIQDGDWIYAWADPIMALSYPPQAGVQLILVNPPQDAGVPTYHQIVSARMSEDGTSLTVLTDKNAVLLIGSDAELAPYLTRNIITLRSLTPGTNVLVWQENAAPEGETPRLSVTKVVAFAYGYKGWIAADAEAGTVAINGESIDLDGGQALAIDSDTFQGDLVPLRAVCEHLGRQVSWDADTRSATVSDPDALQEPFTVTIGSSEVALVGDTTTYLSFPATIHGGRTMVAIQDLARLLGAYYSPNYEY